MENILDVYSKDGSWGVHVTPPESAWRSIFSGNDPIAWPFRQEFEYCRLFYPTDGCHLTAQQYLALTNAVQGIGEDGFFLSIVESQGQSFLNRSWGHWSCDLPSHEEYSELCLTLENALYSRNGHWGVLVSHEMHALVGGTRTFMTELGKHYRRWADDLRLLREYWSGNPNAVWLEAIIDRVAHQ